MRPRLTRSTGWTSEYGRRGLDRPSVAGMPVRAMTPACHRLRRRRQVRDTAAAVLFCVALAVALAIAGLR